MSKHHLIDDTNWVWRMSGLKWDGTAKPVSRDQVVGHEQGHRNFKFQFLCSADHDEQD